MVDGAPINFGECFIYKGLAYSEYLISALFLVILMRHGPYEPISFVSMSVVY